MMRVRLRSSFTLLLASSISTLFAQQQPPQLVSPPFEVYRTTLGGGDETFSIGNGLSAGKPNDDVMYAVTAKGNVYTLRESDGTQLNSYIRRGDNDANTPITSSSSRLDWDRDGEIGVYAEGGNNVIVMDAEGNFVEEFSVDGAIVGQPIIHLGKIFMSHFDQAFSGNGLVTVYSLDINTVEAQFTLSGTKPGPCGKNSNVNVYFGTDKGELIGINVETLMRTEYIGPLCHAR